MNALCYPECPGVTGHNNRKDPVSHCAGNGIGLNQVFRPRDFDWIAACAA
jgi:hypothetical protein